MKDEKFSFPFETACKVKNSNIGWPCYFKF